jgi:serine protease AprX
VFRWRWMTVAALAMFALALASVTGAARGDSSWTAKVDASVLDAAALGPTEMLIYLEQQADLSRAAQLATKEEKGQHVYSALQAVAAATQPALVDELDRLGAEHQEFWIVNTIWAKGDLAVVRAMAERSEVAHVYAVGRGRLDPPVPGGAETTTLVDAVGPSIAHVRADQVWALGITGQGVTVAGADTGVRWTHTTLRAKYRGWNAETQAVSHDYNWFDGAHASAPTDCPVNSPAPCDDNGHGTHTVGTMVGDDGAGNQIGMAPDAKWIACKNMIEGLGVVPTYLECMQWLLAPTKIGGADPDPVKAPHVVNNSWGCVEVCPPPILEQQLEASRAAGIVYVVSAGNEGAAGCSTIAFPLAIYRGSFTVGATNATNDAIASFSSRGPVLTYPGALPYRKPDITAPGVGIRSATRGSDTAYSSSSGTSMAGPHVAGLVALIISANPALAGNVDAIEDIIERTAVPLPAGGCPVGTGPAVPNNIYGWGRIDALAAVQEAQRYTPSVSSPSSERISLPAQTVDIAPPVSTQTHPTVDYGDPSTSADDREGTTEWRIVKNTGNCCENHLTTTREGRLFDIGGSYVNYTDDRGLTWKSVRPLTPLVNGEGSITVAPNGDVLAIEWDPYSGDHLLAYKYNAASGRWFYMENPLHHPFYDRPWISIVPGPFRVAGETVPYLTFVQGGFPLKDPMFVSSDGLTYLEASSLIVDGATDTPVSDWFPIAANESFDWIQPIKRSPVVGLGAGRALGAGGWLLDPADRKWDSWRLPDGSTPPFFVQIDSAGRIHHVLSAGGGQLEYRISADGGRTWTSSVAPVALGGGNLSDFKVNAAAGVGAIATRVGNQDWVYKFDISGDTAQLLRRYRLGLGDTASVVGVTTNLQAPRMDFQTVSIFADGRVAASFLDSTTLSNPPGTGMLGRITPVVAIELETELPPLLPDLSPSPLSVSTQRLQGGDELMFSTTVANTGPAGASGVVVRFLVDGVQVGAERTVAELASGASAAVSSDPWSAKHQAGTHTVEVVVDPANAIAETDEANNTASATFEVKGNKLQNGSFEASSDGSSPDGWSGEGATSYDAGGSDGERSVGAALGGSWTSEPVPVDAGTSYELSAQVAGAGGLLAVQQLSAAGTVVAVSTQQLLATPDFGIAGLTVTAAAGAAQVRVVLVGAATGVTRFDDVQLIER